MFVRREGLEIPCCGIIGIVVAEDALISFSEVICVLDNLQRRLGDKKFLEIELRPISEKEGTLY
jgi:hypothetical protein